MGAHGRTRFGAKAGIEVYARLWDHYIVTPFANAASVYQTYQARAAFMRELTPQTTLGVEGGILGNARYHEPRAGLAATFTFECRIITVYSGYALKLRQRAAAPTSRSRFTGRCDADAAPRARRAYQRR